MEKEKNTNSHKIIDFFAFYGFVFFSFYAFL